MARCCLADAGWPTVSTSDELEARHELASAPPDLLIIDWDLPGDSGLEFLRDAREDRVPGALRVLVNSALARESDVVRALEVGADDYLIKPCSMRELVARVKALLRARRGAAALERLEVGALTLDLADRRAYVGGKAVALHGAQFRLLAHFMAHSDRALLRSQLLEPVWGRSAQVDERTVDVNVRRLRQALAGVGLAHYVQTVRGIGYRLSARC